MTDGYHMPSNPFAAVNKHMNPSLAQKDKGKLRLRELLLAGASSAPTSAANPDYFRKLRDRVSKASRRRAARR